MTPELRADAIKEVSQKGDLDLLRTFSLDMIQGAISKERERCAKIAETEAITVVIPEGMLPADAIRYNAWCSAKIIADRIRGKA